MKRRLPSRKVLPHAFRHLRWHNHACAALRRKRKRRLPFRHILPPALCHRRWRKREAPAFAISSPEASPPFGGTTREGNPHLLEPLFSPTYVGTYSTLRGFPGPASPAHASTKAGTSLLGFPQVPCTPCVGESGVFGAARVPFVASPTHVGTTRTGDTLSGGIGVFATSGGTTRTETLNKNEFLFCGNGIKETCREVTSRRPHRGISRPPTR